MSEKTTTLDIREWATALPEVTEKQHFRFKVPLWQVRGKTFLGMGRDESSAIFCITEGSAEARAADDPDHLALVRRMDTRRTFLGLEVQLGGSSRDLLKELVTEAWAAQAPTILVKQRRASQ